MARVGMTDLIARLRILTSTAEGDTVLNEVSYWTDDQLEQQLDRQTTEFTRIQLQAEKTYTDGVDTYTVFRLPRSVSRDIEIGDEFQIRTLEGDLIDPLTYTFEPQRLKVTFETEPSTIVLYASGFSYDLEKTASQVWLLKAGLRAKLVEWRAGPTAVKEDQEYKHCLEMAKTYGAQNGVTVSRMKRVGYYNG